MADLPLVGWLINAVLSQGPIGLSTIVIVIFLQVMLFRSRWGLRTRAAGEHPRAAETVGIDVIRLRYRNVVMSGRAGRARRRLAEHGADQQLQREHDGRTRVHRPGGDDRRSLDAAGSLRRGAAVRVGHRR